MSLVENEDDDEDEHEISRPDDTIRGFRAMNSALLAVLRCPETRGVLRNATPAELEQINAAIRNSDIRNRNGEKVSELLDDCLICDSAGLCYPVRDGLPVMLTGEAFDIPR